MDYYKAEVYQTNFPHTFNSLQHLVMAMADYANSRGKRSLFGRDKSLGAHQKFEAKLKDTVLALVTDGVINQNEAPSTVRLVLIEALNKFAEVFPNWQDAYAFAHEYLTIEAPSAEDLFLYWQQSVHRDEIDHEQERRDKIAAHNASIHQKISALDKQRSPYVAALYNAKSPQERRKAAAKLLPLDTRRAELLRALQSE